MPFWLFGGKARLKQRVAEHTDLRVDLLPYDPDVVAYARAAKAAGRPVVLATAANARCAHRVAEHLGIFDAVYASDSTVNLAAGRKAEVLSGSYGDCGFDYLADSRKDVAIWRRARQVLVANPKPGLLSTLRRQGLSYSVVSARAGRLGPLVRALRPHQWLKNVLVFLPLLTAHLYTSAGSVLACAAAFVAFSLIASAGYLVNDLLDLEADRLHPRKRLRPFASGDLPLVLGLGLNPLLICAGFAVAVRLNSLFVAILALYLFVTVAYSLHLKRRTTLDVLVLAGLYTLRVLGGAVALDLTPSFWLLAFSMFIFLGLAFGKRFTELKSVSQLGGRAAAGRGYLVEDLELVRSFGISAHFGALLVLALYINSPQIRVLYSHPEMIWLLCPVFLYWVIRFWTLAQRDLMHDDPMVFAVGDRVSQLSILAALTIVSLAV